MPTETTRDPATGTPNPTTEELEGEVPGFRPTRTRTPDTPTRTLPADTPKVWDPTSPEGSPSPSSSPAGDSPSMSSPRTSSSPGSTPDDDGPPQPTANPEDLEELVGALVHLGLGTPALMLNERRTPGTTVWLLDADDVANIAGPIARIAARRVPAVDGETSDVVDGLLATIGLGGYVMKNVHAERELRAAAGGATIERPGRLVDEVPVG